MHACTQGEGQAAVPAQGTVDSTGSVDRPAEGSLDNLQLTQALDAAQAAEAECEELRQAVGELEQRLDDTSAQLLEVSCERGVTIRRLRPRICSASAQQEQAL